jgi:glycerophosphoryl diester phosphodiesterase
VRRLRARERYPHLRPASAAFDGREPVLELPEVVALAEELGVLLVVEVKDAAASTAVGLDPVPLVVRDLAGARCPIVLESFEKTPLDALAGLGHPCVYLIDDEGAAPDEPDRTYAEELADPGALARFAGVSVATTLVSPAVVAAAHAAGLEVWTWTLRPEYAFLPANRRIGTDPAASGDWRGAWGALLDAGVDAVFADHPDLAVALRAERHPLAHAAPRSTMSV